MSLTYNRTLFTQAGLDPNKPPTTWDEVKADAKIIADKTGMAGFAEMATQNTGGWQLTTMTYALGGRMETVGNDGKVTATVNNAATKSALQFLHSLRWDDNSMGAHLRLQLGHHQPGLRGRPDRHVHRRLRPLHRHGPEQQPQARRLRRHAIPLASDPNAGVLGGGTLAAVNVVTTEAQRDAAVHWIDFYCMNKLRTQDGAVADAKALKANKQPSAFPPCRSSTRPPTTRSSSGSRTHQRSHRPDDSVHQQDLRPAAGH